MKNTPLLKLGGAVAEDAAALAALRKALEAAPAVVVHGAGPQIDRACAAAGLGPPRKVHGRRVTTPEEMRCVEAAAGALNAFLAQELGAIGVPGTAVVRVRKRPPLYIDGGLVDFGLVGDVVGVDPAPLRAILAAGQSPVVSCLGADAAGRAFNVNADTVALELARALGAPELTMWTGTGGVLDASGRTLARLRASSIDARIASGEVSGGMRAKLEACRAALRAGIPQARVGATLVVDE